VGNIASGISAVQPYASFGFFDLRGFPGYRIDLLAGTTVIASDNDTLNPDEGEFLTSTFDVVIGNGHDDEGEPLTIRLVNLNEQDINDPVIDLEVDFDNVRLDATPLASADFEGDGDVDSDDLATWQLAYGISADGDATGDGQSNGADFLAWQRQFTGEVELAAANVAVPEPGIILLAAVLSLMLVTMRK
jgi:hypothetical protein